jgi:hypothetical protein
LTNYGVYLERNLPEYYRFLGRDVLALLEHVASIFMAEESTLKMEVVGYAEALVTIARLDDVTSQKTVTCVSSRFFTTTTTTTNTAIITANPIRLAQMVTLETWYLGGDGFESGTLDIVTGITCNYATTASFHIFPDLSPNNHPTI